MADRKISQLVETVLPNTEDVLPIVSENVTKKVTLNNAVGASTFSTNSINVLTDAAPGPLDTIANPGNEQFVIQSTSGSIPRKLKISNIYPIAISTNTINISFNNGNRNLTAFIKPNSINGSHLGTGVIQTSAIENGAITEAKIDPNAKIGGATGGGTDRAFYVNDQAVNFNFEIPTGKNAMSAGPITVQSGITVTVPNGSVWTVV
jgi:hypothetical protein